MFKLKKDDDVQSVSNMSRTSKNVMDMSVNELLGMRIPVPTSNANLRVSRDVDG